MNGTPWRERGGLTRLPLPWPGSSGRRTESPAAPFWDLSFPALLRVYIEHISANGLTYHYESDGCHGDCMASRLAYLTTGGDLERPQSLGVLYWKQLAAMFGIPRFDYVFAGGLDLDPSQAPAVMEASCEEARALGRNF